MSRVLVLLLSVLMSSVAAAATEAQSDFEAIKSLPMLMVYQMGGHSITPAELKVIAQKRADEMGETLRYLDNATLKDIARREKAEWATILNVAEKVEAESASLTATATQNEKIEGDI